MVLMTFLMAGQLCAGLHRHLLTALSPHLLILVLAIIVIAIIMVCARNTYGMNTYRYSFRR